MNRSFFAIFVAFLATSHARTAVISRSTLSSTTTSVRETTTITTTTVDIEPTSTQVEDPGTTTCVTFLFPGDDTITGMPSTTTDSDSRVLTPTLIPDSRTL
ncbi:hypothetical protein B0H34DRAFT_803264 [Crassisporium funariophilum]|nr:hypothetical protein B0H34DRAFT_803264 [Crassisporium funariophilum]